MPGPATQDTELIAARVNKRVVAEIESIAQREDENRSTIVRRLLRRGLESERRSVNGEAAR